MFKVKDIEVGPRSSCPFFVGLDADRGTATARGDGPAVRLHEDLVFRVDIDESPLEERGLGERRERQKGKDKHLWLVGGWCNRHSREWDQNRNKNKSYQRKTILPKSQIVGKFVHRKQGKGDRALPKTPKDSSSLFSKEKKHKRNKRQKWRDSLDHEGDPKK